VQVYRQAGRQQVQAEVKPAGSAGAGRQAGEPAVQVQVQCSQVQAVVQVAGRQAGSAGRGSAVINQTTDQQTRRNEEARSGTVQRALRAAYGRGRDNGNNDWRMAADGMNKKRRKCSASRCTARYGGVIRHMFAHQHRSMVRYGAQPAPAGMAALKRNAYTAAYNGERVAYTPAPRVTETKHHGMPYPQQRMRACCSGRMHHVSHGTSTRIW